jgi:hypothetical protein
LRELIQPIDPKEEELSIIHSSFDCIIDECQKHVVEEVVGEAALFTINATKYRKKGENPFYMGYEKEYLFQIPRVLEVDIEFYRPRRIEMVPRR